MAYLPISPEPGRNQIFAKADDTAIGASGRARCRARGRSVRWLHRRSANRWARSGSFRQIRATSTICKNAEQTTRRERRRTAALQQSSELNARKHPQQIRRQRCKLRTRYRVLRVNDDVPSCGYLRAVATHDFANPPPNAIAHHRATERLLDAEAKAGLRQSIGAKESSEVGTRAALTGAVHGVKISAAHQPRLARKIQTLRFTRA